MSIPAHAELIHAFADGKTLEMRNSERMTDWTVWRHQYCPDFTINGREWRIKPEPKVTRYLAWEYHDGEFRMAREGSQYAERLYKNNVGWKRIPALDKEVIVGEE